MPEVDYGESDRLATLLRRYAFMIGLEDSDMRADLRRAAAMLTASADETLKARRMVELMEERVAAARTERDKLIEEIHRRWGETIADEKQSPVTEMPSPLAPFARHISEVDNRLLSARVVYFLVADGEVVYVGESYRPLERIAVHTAKIRFDRAFFMKVEDGDALAVEKTFIKLLKPRYNLAHLNGCKYHDHDAIMARYSEAPTARGDLVCPDHTARNGTSTAADGSPRSMERSSTSPRESEETTSQLGAASRWQPGITSMPS